MHEKVGKPLEIDSIKSQISSMYLVVKWTAQKDTIKDIISDTKNVKYLHSWCIYWKAL